MLQLQYYNNKLTKTQIDGILNTFNIKYTTVKNEIDSKINSLIKLAMDDILKFLQNIEEITKERKKIKDFENIQREYEILSSKLKEKTLNEHKLENDIESLQKEIEYLKNENKNQQSKINEIKTPVTSKYRAVRTTFTNKKQVKIKTDFLNTTLNNDNTNSTTKRNTYTNKNKSRPKTSTNTTHNKEKITNTRISSSVNKRKTDNNKSIVNDKKNYSPDIVTITKKNIVNNSNKFEKTIQKIKQYSTNRYSERIKKMQNFRASKNRNKLIKTKFRNNISDSNITTNLTGYKKNASNIKEKKNDKEKDKDKEKEDDDDSDDLEKNKTFEHARNFLKLVESIPPKDTINGNNYSEDDEEKHNCKSESMVSKTISEEEENNYNEESIENEIKELEEDEDNILQIIKQIKDLNLLT